MTIDRNQPADPPVIEIWLNALSLIRASPEFCEDIGRQISEQLKLVSGYPRQLTVKVTAS